MCPLSSLTVSPATADLSEYHEVVQTSSLPVSLVATITIFQVVFYDSVNLKFRIIKIKLNFHILPYGLIVR